MKTFFIFLLTFTAFIQTSLAQKQAYNWTFSDSIRVDFTDGINPNVSFVPLPISPSINRNECDATYSDENGNLLAYFVANKLAFLEGKYYPTCKILDDNNQLFINGDSLRGDSDFTNGAIFLPFKDNENKDKLYLFTLSFDYLPVGKKQAFYCHIIDLNEKKVIQKNKELYADSSNFLPSIKYQFDEKLAAVRHTNGVDWWLMGYNRKESYFLRWRVTSSGIIGPFSQIIGTYLPDSTILGFRTGEMTFNAQGTRLALVSGGGVFDVFSFDRCTGLLSDWTPLINSNINYINDINIGLPYSVEFSPNGNILYFGTHDSLFQFDLTASNVIASKYLVHTVNYPSVHMCQQQLAPNGKIYVTYSIDSSLDSLNRYLSAIQYPDSVGAACQFTPHALYLKGKKSSNGLPNMPAFLPGAIAPDILQANAGITERFLCPGDSVLLGAPALPDAVYRWRPAVGLSDTTVAMPFAKPDISTTYTLWVSDSAQNICTQTVALTKISIPQFPAGFSVATDAFLATFTVNIETGATHKKYKWSFGDNASLTKTYPIAYHTYQDTGTYFVNLTIIDTLSGCEKTFSDTLILKVSAEQEYCINKTTHFRVYPNPTRGNVTLWASQNATVEIYNATGNLILRKDLSEDETASLSLSDFPAGVYVCRFIDEKAKTVAAYKLIRLD